MSEATPGLVTVFGGSGFVGAQVVRALAKRGWRVRVAVRHPDRAYDLRPQGDVGQIVAVRCDATKPEQVAAALKGADAAINLIGILFETPKRTFQALHVDASRLIAEGCVVQGVDRLVQVSAIGADLLAKSAYARTKGEAETAVRAARADTVILRPSIIFGDGDGFLNRFAQMAQTAPALPLIGGGRTRFQPVYVGDVAEAVARATVHPELAGRTFELGGPAVMTFREVLELILRETHQKRALISLPFFFARLMGRVAQTTAAVGIAPVLTQDQVVSLQSDNVVTSGADGLAALGIEATGIEAIAPTYLWRYRKGGQFAAQSAQVAAQ